MYEVKLTRKARKFYEKADAVLARRLNQCFEQLQQNPYESSNIKSLEGPFKGCFRYRVGDWRVIYRIEQVSEVEANGDDEEGTVTVLLIAHRREAYRDR